ncbi:MAG: hypothetical protein ROW52_00855 [Anaerolineaceae bacterium]|jgi:hypothetical protein
MNIEILTICDAAVDYGGRLSILGAFDVIHAHRFPAVHPHCSVALRIRFEHSETGQHPFVLHIVDDDGNDIIPLLQGNIEVKMPPGFVSSAVNVVLNLQGLKLERPGWYSVNIDVDGEERSFLPLYVRRAAG